MTVHNVLTGILTTAREMAHANSMNKHTFAAYERHWQSYINQLDEAMVESFSDVTPATVNLYLRPLVKAPSAYHQARAAILSLLTKAIKAGADVPRFADFKDDVKIIKTVTKDKLFMTPEQMDTVYRNLECRNGHESGVYRDMLVFRIMRETLMRSEEVHNLNVADIDKEGREIGVRGKEAMVDEDGNKIVSRTVFCSRSLLENIDAYMVKHRHSLKGDSRPVTGFAGCYYTATPLFTSSYGNRLSVKVIKNTMSDAVKYALPKKLLKSSSGAHAIRRSSATIIYNKTKDVVLVQRMLGHADPKTTMRYIGVSNEGLRAGFGILGAE